MKTITKTFYICEICNEEYKTKKEALSCESKPVTGDKGVKVGDTVIVLNGDGTGEKAKVTRRIIYSKEWGHYAWNRFWHTVGLDVEFENGFSRQLNFYNYETNT